MNINAWQLASRSTSNLLLFEGLIPQLSLPVVALHSILTRSIMTMQALNVILHFTCFIGK